MGFGVQETRNTRAGSHEAAGIFISRDLETPNASNERLQADRTCSTFPSGERRWTISMSSAGNRAVARAPGRSRSRIAHVIRAPGRSRSRIAHFIRDKRGSMQPQRTGDSPAHWQRNRAPLAHFPVLGGDAIRRHPGAAEFAQMRRQAMNEGCFAHP